MNATFFITVIVGHGIGPMGFAVLGFILSIPTMTGFPDIEAIAMLVAVFSMLLSALAAWLLRTTRAAFVIPMTCMSALFAVWLLYTFHSDAPLFATVLATPFLLTCLFILAFGLYFLINTPGPRRH